jgi:hypothetical protein
MRSGAFLTLANHTYSYIYYIRISILRYASIVVILQKRKNKSGCLNRNASLIGLFLGCFLTVLSVDFFRTLRGKKIH